MKRAVAATLLSFLMLSAADARDGARDTALIEMASAGTPYNYVIHVRNTYTYGYNPEIEIDRRAMALKSVKDKCPRPRIVGEKVVNTEIFGITSNFPDYVFMVGCS